MSPLKSEKTTVIVQANGIEEDEEQMAVDQNQAIEYALNRGKKTSNFIFMELLLNVDNLPKIDGYPAHVMAILYVDQNT
eukprot:CAMPEP_0170505068 /NCGR_PEP_ID=MMETSP0208-20121228/49735_1 /TAXON_ID=197538 /ORGANISM="Strombidium inclinatum, Strain S3" /LENGTH=78 /DNA_ID=CAMNT_0010785683 /DNA_START=48 /DNA_END=281 /DNA_ORIENTATION=+